MCLFGPFLICFQVFQAELGSRRRMYRLENPIIRPKFCVHRQLEVPSNPPHPHNERALTKLDETNAHVPNPASRKHKPPPLLKSRPDVRLNNALNSLTSRWTSNQSVGAAGPADPRTNGRAGVVVRLMWGSLTYISHRSNPF